MKNYLYESFLYKKRGDTYILDEDSEIISHESYLLENTTMNKIMVEILEDYAEFRDQILLNLRDEDRNDEVIHTELYLEDGEFIFEDLINHEILYIRVAETN